MSSEMYPSSTPHLLVAWGRKIVWSTGDRLHEALMVRDDDVAWLRGHVAQLTQQLSLPPSEEEAKKRLVAVLEKLTFDHRNLFRYLGYKEAN